MKKLETSLNIISLLHVTTYIAYDFIKDRQTNPRDSVKIHQLLKAKQYLEIN